jgi:hypothetical protein
LLEGRFGHGESTDVVIGAARKGRGGSEAEGKVMIWHRTRSVSGQFVPITISVNGLNGHGMAELGVSGNGNENETGNENQSGENKSGENKSGNGNETGTGNGNTTGTGSPGSQVVLGERASGSSGSPGSAGTSGEAGVAAAGTGAAATAPSSAVASRESASGQLPFTGSNTVIVLLAAAGCLIGGLALRKFAHSQS